MTQTGVADESLVLESIVSNFVRPPMLNPGKEYGIFRANRDWHRSERVVEWDNYCTKSFASSSQHWAMTIGQP